MVKVGINGFGRIGRLILRALLENYKGKIWNICLTNPINECYKPNQEINVLNENVLQGGLNLDLWEIK